ncbi:class Ib ribonucleoside-diphosphate reductase assembly flavoprotein NrdI [Bacillus paralicheniformis]|uniref:class Ib ribonucleoside-diphosphate reductase assembly flavoprotein NrdI n=1 Tax=Bacillus TaxID=1386 RepID=UPI000934CBD5|nr:class Ib ribonucleoside-diphosphate reductase assembly flavoprotein NrdI [Bacillus licheniformis]OJT64884.1 ribonucleotide reductase assembly protein NrdI [Bacillus licheniformis]UAL27057.1 class Ib ribonucleoside-diphosphate reductase assembly flavoprotein NrdI [Bacillus paralicheniformis]
MLVTYESMTGNVRRFVRKLEQKMQIKTMEITEDLKVDEPFIHITYTIKLGQIPEKTQKFIHNNKDFLYGVCSSGNRNWGSYYAAAADKLSQHYQVPVLLKFELSGSDSDLDKLIQEVKFIDSNQSGAKVGSTE